MKETKQENEFKPEWYHCVPVKVEKIVLERTGKNGEQLVRIRLETDLGNITYKPKKQQTVIEKLAGFETEIKKTDLFSTSEFITENPLLVELSKNCKEEPQEVILGYGEISRFNDEEGEPDYFKFMMEGQFKSLYYEKYHKTDKSNLEKQKEKKQKYQETEL